MFSIDQQPYLQGYLAVFAVERLRQLRARPADETVLTGPGIVDAANVDATLAGCAAAGAR